MICKPNCKIKILIILLFSKPFEVLYTCFDKFPTKLSYPLAFDVHGKYKRHDLQTPNNKLKRLGRVITNKTGAKVFKDSSSNYFSTFCFLENKTIFSFASPTPKHNLILVGSNSIVLVCEKLYLFDCALPSTERK